MKKHEYIISVANKSPREPNSRKRNKEDLQGCISSKESFAFHCLVEGADLFSYFEPTEAIKENVYRLAVYPRLEHEEIRKMKEKFGDTIRIFKLDLQ